MVWLKISFLVVFCLVGVTTITILVIAVRDSVKRRTVSKIKKGTEFYDQSKTLDA